MEEAHERCDGNRVSRLVLAEDLMGKCGNATSSFVGRDTGFLDGMSGSRVDVVSMH